VGRALDLIRPDLLAFSKTDVWPNLTREAARRGIPMVLLSATLPESSSRMGGGARHLLGPAYRRLNHVAAISSADAERFGALGVPAERRSVMGDARFDQVLKRTGAASDSPWPGRLASNAHFVLVAGSTWPADEEVLLRALRQAGERSPPLRLVLAPHEPTPDHLRATEALLGRLGFSSQRLAAVEEEPVTAEVVLVDRVGILGDLYAAGAAAYVGGGWGTAGLHSVLEPAAFGLPVLFGPRHANAREAGELVTAGGAFSVDDGEELRDRIAELWGNEEARRRAGAASAAYVEAGRGAAERGAGVVLANGEL
jgi:3-deoxy-D-manno-octulosonic-acid transferase